jgi:hypothetical protein
MDSNIQSNNNASAKSSASLSFENFSALENLEYTMYKHMYVDICDDLISGILLSKIVYWFGKSKKGEQRARHLHQGRLCIVKKKSDWWDECRISEKQFDRAIGKLMEMKILSTEVHYNPFADRQNERATFIFLDQKALMEVVNLFLEKEKKGIFTNPEIGFSQTTEMEVCEEYQKEVCANTPSGGLYTDTMNTPMTTSQSECTHAKISKSKKQKAPQPEKIAYRDLVTLTPEEHEKLLVLHGPDKLAWMLDKLDCTKASTGRQYKSDYHTMKNWVSNAYDEYIIKCRSSGVPAAGDNSKSPMQLANDAKYSLESSYYDISTDEKGVNFVATTGAGYRCIPLPYKTPNFERELQHHLDKFGFRKRK